MIEVANDEPLIWTSKGNLPISALTYQTAWDVQPSYIKFVERYLDATGEVVKESAHVSVVGAVRLVRDTSVDVPNWCCPSRISCLKLVVIA